MFLRFEMDPIKLHKSKCSHMQITFDFVLVYVPAYALITFDVLKIPLQLAAIQRLVCCCHDSFNDFTASNIRQIFNMKW